MRKLALVGNELITDTLQYKRNDHIYDEIKVNEYK